ncbi:MAG: Zn-ribbon domain-containing OB-fold protein, partial [Gammaproteobacteria bacterium]
MNTPSPARSPASAGLAGFVPDGSLQLQRCSACGETQYPPRERCGHCLADCLQWQAVPAGGTVLASTALAHSLEPWYAARAPWTMASLRLEAGPVAFAHIRARDAAPGTRLQLATARDAGGGWCLVAFGPAEKDSMKALQ